VDELTRVSLIEASNTTGGDGSPLVLDVESHAVKDVVGNNNTNQYGVAVIEIQDSRKTMITAVNVDYNNGRVTVTADEILDLTPSSKVDGTKLFYGRDQSEMFNFGSASNSYLSSIVRSPMTDNILQTAGTTGTTLRYPLTGGIVIESSSDDYSFSFIMPEASRVAAMQ
jgi:hypothetical protein